jgi:hypothetical protein
VVFKSGYLFCDIPLMKIYSYSRRLRQNGGTEAGLAEIGFGNVN